jgi:hypothetical protein
MPKARRAGDMAQVVECLPGKPEYHKEDRREGGKEGGKGEGRKEGRKVYFGSQFWRFQSITCWPHWFWAFVNTAQHEGSTW